MAVAARDEGGIFMNATFLFNSDHPSLGGCYGLCVMDRILSTGVLQQANRHMRVSIGDILIYDAAVNDETLTSSFLTRLCHAVYRPKSFDHLIYDRLGATHGKATVFCWLFQNMTAPIAERLHIRLASHAAYLGTMDVDFSESLHLRFFRNSLCEEYRFRGKRCSIFYEMGQNEDPDIRMCEMFEQHGFTADYEDSGGRRTIFDNYDTLTHFKRVEDFKRVFSRFSGLDADRVSNLAHSLEELHPKLFDVFASAARTLERAETEEDYAQAALSGRRLLERTADYLFPPREETFNGRNVGPAEYKNRLWAYIEQAVIESAVAVPNALVRLGEE